MTAAEQIVPGFKLVFTAEQKARAHQLVDRALESGVLSLGPLTEEFEDRFAALYGFRYAVAVSTGTVALQIALHAVNAGGSTVLCPANTNYATAAAILAAGARVELYDSGVYADVDDLARRLRPGVSAVLVVHIGGFCSPALGRILQVCDRAGVPVVEDCAHAHGAALDRVAAGNHGLVGAFSFFPTKPLTTGEGGLLVTRDPEIARKARSYRNQGKDAAGEHVLSGSSWRLPEVCAAVGLAQLPDAEQERLHRAGIAASFDKALAGGKLVPLPGSSRQHPSFHKYICRAPTPQARDRVISHMRRHGIEPAGQVYPKPLAALPVFSAQRFEELPKAAEFCATHFCPPLWSRMPQEAADRVRLVLATAREEI